MTKPDEKKLEEHGVDMVIPVPGSIPRIYFKNIAMSSKKDGWVSIILSDRQTVEMYIKEGKIKGTGDRLNPVAEIITDINTLKLFRDVIDERLKRHKELFGE